MSHVKKHYWVLFLLVFVMTFVSCGKNDISQQEDLNTDEIEVDETAMEETLVFVCDDYPPFLNKEGELPGFYVDLLAHILKPHDINVEVEYYSWTRSLDKVLSDEAFATIPWVANAERMKETNFTNNIFTTKTVVAYLKSNERVKDDFTHISQLKTYDVGTVKTYYYIEDLEALGFELDSSDTDKEAMTKLYNGRYDILLLNEDIYNGILETEFPEVKDAFTFMKTPYKEIFFSIRVGKTYPDKDRYIAIINNGLKKALEDGTYLALAEKYGLQISDVDALLKPYNMEKIIIGLEDYPPYEYVDKRGYVIGIGVDVLREALSSSGVPESKYEFLVAPWSRLMEMGKRGDVDIVLDAFMTEERERLYYYSSQVYGVYEYYLIAMSDRNLDFDGEKFSSPVKRIGLVRGYAYGDKIETLITELGLVVDEVGTTDELIEGLLNGRYDLIVEAKENAQFYLKEHSVDHKLEYLWEPVDRVESYIIYSKKNNMEEWKDIIDKKIEEIKRQGTYQKIRNGYLESE